PLPPPTRPPRLLDRLGGRRRRGAVPQRPLRPGQAIAGDAGGGVGGALERDPRDSRDNRDSREGPSLSLMSLQSLLSLGSLSSQLNRSPGYTATSEPSAKKAEEGPASKGLPNGSP